MSKGLTVPHCLCHHTQTPCSLPVIGAGHRRVKGCKDVGKPSDKTGMFGPAANQANRYHVTT